MTFQSVLKSTVTMSTVTATTTFLSSTTSLIPSATSTTIPGDGDSGDDGDNTLRKWSSLIGIVTAIVGNVLIALALNVQRYAHTRSILKRAQSGNNQPGFYGAVSGSANGSSTGNGTANGQADGHHDDAETDPLSASFQSDATTVPQDPADADKVSSNYLKSPYWWLGQILITLGEMGNFLAYGFAPASIVSPLGVVALISNCIIAPAMFHEKFRQRDFWGVVIAVGGVVTVVLSAKQEETKLDPGDILDAITTMEFEIYLGVTVFLIAVLMWASGRYGRRTSLIDLGLVGLFGGYTALATKGISSMLSSTLWRAFTAPLTYLLLFVLLGTAVMQIRYVNKALQRFDSTQVIPIQFVMFTLCVIIGSAVLYRDFEKTTPERAAKFVGGCLLTFFGVFLITSGRQRKDDDEELLEDADGIDETIGLMDQDGNPAPGPENHSVADTMSRRSSKGSRVNFAEPFKAPYRDDPDDSEIMRPGTPPGRVIDYSDGQAIESPQRSGRTLSAYSVASAPAQPVTNVPPLPPTIREPLATPPQHGTDRPVTPRTNTATSKSTTRDRDRTFYSPSPLYSTVTTVVKDALRENVRLKDQSSMRRLRSSIRASLFIDSDEEDHTGSENDTQQTIVAPPGNDLLRVLTGPESGGDSGGEHHHKRTRSLSETVGSFFRKKKAKNSDVESGPDENNEDPAA